MRFSVVASLYNCERLIEEFHQRISAVMKATGESYEIILVNDGSTDQTLTKAKAIQVSDPCLTLIDFEKNFGFPEALFCGLKYATGDYIFIIDSDLEEPPEVFHQFWDTIKGRDLDAVYGIQSTRKGGWFERWAGELFYSLVDVVFPDRYSKNTLAVRIFKKEYKDKVLTYHELLSDIWIAFTHASDRQQALPIVKGHKGWTSFNFQKKVVTAIKILTDLSLMSILDGFKRKNRPTFRKLSKELSTLMRRRRLSSLYRVKNIYTTENCNGSEKIS